MKKIVFIAANENIRWGGSELLWSATAERFKRNGFEVWISVKGWNTPVKQIERLCSVGCRIFYRQTPSLVERLERRAFPGRFFRRHIRMLGVNAALVVISQGGNSDGLDWMEAANANGLNYAALVQGASDLSWPEDTVAERLASAYERARAAYFVSEANLNLTRDQFASKLENGKLVRNPFNVRYDSRCPWPSDFTHGLALACIARLDMGGKGQDLLMHVLNLPHWRERKVQVSLVGEGPNERVLHSMARKLRLSNVEFVGQLHNIEDVWARHHALVLPTRFEGMPLVVVEAMLCGRPCIVTDVGGSRELIRDDINGFLAKAPTVGLLDEAMNRAWDRREDLRSMGEIAASDVREWVSEDPAEDFARDLEALVR
jgi:glycosyltransferase involved in cell wall biosynthesis